MFQTQALLPLEFPPDLSMDRFCVSDSNREAFFWIQRWEEWPHHILSLYGPSGSGKTHLGKIWQVKTSALWVNPQNLVDILQNDHPKKGFFILDEAHRITDPQAFLHLYNFILEEKGFLLLLAPTPPSHWPYALPDLKSRLHTVLAAEILPPDDLLLRKILKKLFRDWQLEVTEDILDFLIRRMERSFTAGQTLVEKINLEALRMHRPISLPLVREIFYQ